MNEWIDWFQRVLDVSIRLYFRQECDLSSVYDIALPKAGPLWKALLPEQVDPTFDEWMVLMLALMPHLSPQMLDIFLCIIRILTVLIRNLAVGKDYRTEDSCQRVRRPFSYWRAIVWNAVWKWFVYFVKSIGSICITSLAWKEPGMVNRS